MNKKNFMRIFLPTGLMFVLLGAVSPALAYNPTQRYSFVAAGTTTDPGEKTTINNVLFVKNQVGEGNDYGYPWGDATHVQYNNYYLNQTDYKGNLVGHVEKTFDAGMLELYATCNFNGLGMYTYHGPTITVDTSNDPVDITDGMQFFGLPYTGGAVGYATIGHHLFVVSERMTGVSVVTGPLAGFGIVVGTGTARCIR
jgi:hypothetical protein